VRTRLTVSTHWPRCFVVTSHISYCSNTWFSHLGGVVVSVLVTGPKDRGFKPGRSDGFLRAIKIGSTPSLGWEVQPEFPCRKILRHAKDPLTHLRCWYVKFSLLRPVLVSRCLCWHDCQRALVDESGVIPSRHQHHHDSPRSYITWGDDVGGRGYETISPPRYNQSINQSTYGLRRLSEA
jgi:hypothetical protein